jgi:type II secretion system protein G
MLKGKKGFTLIELLIVIVIIGILAGIVVGIVGTSSRHKANDAKQKSIVHEVQNALEQYFSDNNAYPTGDAAAMKTALTGANVLGSDVNVTKLTYTHDAGPPECYTVQFTLENQGDSGDNVSGTSPNKIFSVKCKQ